MTHFCKNDPLLQLEVDPPLSTLGSSHTGVSRNTVRKKGASH